MYLADNVIVEFLTKGYRLQVAGQTCNLQPNAIELIHTGNQHVINH